MDEVPEPVVQEPPKKRAKKAAPTGPKKPLSAYMFFCKDQRPVIKEENPDATFGELGRLLGTKWKTYSTEDKAPFQEQANEDKKRYVSEGGGPTTKAGGKKTKKERTGPKRPMSAYMYFSQEMRPKIKEELPDLNFAGLGKEVGLRWKTCEGDDRAPFDKKAAKDKARYQTEVAAEKAGKKAAPVEEAAEESGSGSDSDADSESD